MSILAEKNSEDAWLDADDDWEGNTRSFWQVETCPEYCKCSPQSWRNAKAWSYIGPDKALGYVKNHLMASSLHAMTDAEADALVKEILPGEYTEDFREREAYRNGILRKDATPGPRPPSRSPPRSMRPRSRSRRAHRSLSPLKGNGKNNGKGIIMDQLNTLNTQVSRMSDALANFRDVQRDSGAASSGSGSIGARPSGSGSIVGPVDAMLQVRKSLERASASCDRGAQFAQAMADSFRSEGQVIRGAYDALDAVMAESLRRSVGR